MQAEIETYARELRFILDQIVVALDGLTVAQLNWRPATDAANSAWAIASHVVGSTRVYALGFGCGHEVTRDRAGEFAAAGSDAAELVAAIRRFAAELDAALAGLAPAALERREALVESIRHAALHLGELRLTRDLALQQTQG